MAIAAAAIATAVGIVHAASGARRLRSRATARSAAIRQATFPWADTPGDDIVFEMVPESQIGTSVTTPPTLTEIHGFVRHFGFGGCDYYVHVDTST